MSAVTSHPIDLDALYRDAGKFLCRALTKKVGPTQAIEILLVLQSRPEPLSPEHDALMKIAQQLTQNVQALAPAKGGE